MKRMIDKFSYMICDTTNIKESLEAIRKVLDQRGEECEDKRFKAMTMYHNTKMKL